MKLSVTYLTHCSFIVETASYQLVFDWIAGTIPKSNKKRVGFITHAHADHFNEQVTSIEFDGWVVSDDVKMFSHDTLFRVKPMSQCQIFDIHVKAYDSTDAGVSFLVECDGITIFFAGDLNNWHWKNESSSEEINEMNELYLQMIEPLRDKDVDILFIDIDPRLEVDYDLGARQLLELINPKAVFPMHFTSDINAFKQYLKESQIKQLVPLVNENSRAELIVEQKT